MKDPEHVVKELRKAGWEVNVRHVTEVVLISPANPRWRFGAARCSDQDDYSKSIGLGVALERALKDCRDDVSVEMPQLSPAAAEAVADAEATVASHTQTRRWRWLW